VVGRLLNYVGIKIGQDIASVMQLDSSKHCPNYGLRQLFSEDNFPPTTTAILKVFTVISKYEQKFCVWDECHFFFEIHWFKMCTEMILYMF